MQAARRLCHQCSFTHCMEVCGKTGICRLLQKKLPPPFLVVRLGRLPAVESDMPVHINGSSLQFTRVENEDLVQIPLASSEVSRAADPQVLIVKCHSFDVDFKRAPEKQKPYQVAWSSATYICHACLNRNLRGFRCHSSTATAELPTGPPSSLDVFFCPACAALGATANTWLLSVSGGEVSVQSTLKALACAGAIRTDLSTSFQVQEQELARGTFASVHRVFPKGWTLTSDQCAGECLVAKFFDTRSPEKKGSALDSIMAEMSSLAMVHDHPNIVGIHGLFRNLPGNSPWPNAAEHAIMMDFCGGDLWKLITSSRFLLSEQQAAEILNGLLSALDHVHSRDMVHRDVKVENILIASSGRPVLADFGLAALKSDRMQMSRKCGSPGYAAPEILMHLDYDEKIDVFAAGVVFYFMLCGKTPFHGPDVASILRRTIRCHIKFDSSRKSQPWSNYCKWYTGSLLCKSPDDRPDAREACVNLVPICCRDKLLQAETFDARSRCNTPGHDERPTTASDVARCSAADRISWNDDAMVDLAFVSPSPPTSQQPQQGSKGFVRRAWHGNSGERTAERGAEFGNITDDSPSCSAAAIRTPNSSKGPKRIFFRRVPVHSQWPSGASSRKAEPQASENSGECSYGSMAKPGPQFEDGPIFTMDSSISAMQPGHTLGSTGPAVGLPVFRKLRATSRPSRLRQLGHRTFQLSNSALDSDEVDVAVDI